MGLIERMPGAASKALGSAGWGRLRPGSSGSESMPQTGSTNDGARQIPKVRLCLLPVTPAAAATWSAFDAPAGAAALAGLASLGSVAFARFTLGRSLKVGMGLNAFDFDR